LQFKVVHAGECDINVNVPAGDTRKYALIGRDHVEVRNKLVLRHYIHLRLKCSDKVAQENADIQPRGAIGGEWGAFKLQNTLGTDTR
jgi:hypothetical protein